ncbi:MAG: ASCH domain-containing protein [Bacilli bacterium]|nr:ASCH domain-containing protein [Bacilli bacterium]
MTVIKFKKRFYQAIKDGSKTQTLRIPKKRLELKKYDFATCIFEDLDEQIYVTITDVGYKYWQSLNEKDAEMEGFGSVDDLKKFLSEIYPDVPPWGRLYYYRFQVEGITEKVE